MQLLPIGLNIVLLAALAFSGSEVGAFMTNRTSSHSFSTYIGDDPSDSPDQDRFGRYPFAKRIAETIVHRQDAQNLIIGIYGAWGDGKTTTLNFIKHEIQDRENIVCISFNPWRFSDEADLLLGFYQTIADSLEQKLKGAVDNLKGAVEGLSQLVSVFSDVSGKGIKAIGSFIPFKSLEDYKKKLQDILISQGKYVVIMIDDIDRLDIHEIQTIFRLVKLSADFKYTTYILSFDEEIVADALSLRYGNQGKMNGYKFLEKIISVPLNLPRIPLFVLREYCIEYVMKNLNLANFHLTDQERLSFIYLLSQGLAIRIKTPRMAKRYANALSFALPILRGEVNYVDLMIIEGFRIFFPEMYTEIRNNPEIFLGYESNNNPEKYKEDVLETLERIEKIYTMKETEALKLLIFQMFPAFSSIIQGKGAINIRKQGFDGKNIYSEYYFDKYFSYSVIGSDIPDNTIDEFFNSIASMSIHQIDSTIKSFLTKCEPQVILDKIVSRALYKDHQIIAKLAIGLAMNSNSFYSDESLISFSKYDFLAIRIAGLFQNIDTKTSLNIAKSIIMKGNNLIFSVAFYRVAMLRIVLGLKPTPDELKKLGKKTAEVINNYISKNGIYNGIDSFYFSYIMNIWSEYFSKETTSSYILKTFDDDINNIYRFLSIYFFGFYALGFFEDDDSYSNLNSIVDTKILYEKIYAIYGSILDEPNPFIYDHLGHDLTDTQHNEKYIHIFSYLYHRSQGTIKSNYLFDKSQEDRL